MSEDKDDKAKKTPDIMDLYGAINAAELLDEEDLRQIGSLVLAEFQYDKDSVAEWEQTNDDAMLIAKQVYETKSTPWDNAANVKYPLMTSAAIQYAARTYPEIIRNGKVVNAMVLGDDPTGQKEQRARRVSEHMSTQLLVDDPEWESDTDRLLHSLAIVGLVFKKTYWDELEKRNRSIMCAPKDVIVNRDIKSIETARRVTHVLRLYKNDIVAGVRYGIYSDEILEHINRSDEDEDDKSATGYQKRSPLESDYLDELHEVYEQHRWLDLDKDGYEEPYIVTVHKDSGIVMRIYRCFDLESVHYNAKDQIWKIDAVCYFTDFHFIPNPDGTYHSIGLGQLLLPINEAINTLCNQLLDAGTLSNQQNGFLARNFKSKSGAMRLAPGEFKKLDIAASDLASSIYPLPVREPSQVLFQMLGLLIQSGKELSSVSDVLNGQQDSKDSAPTTVLAMIEQGLKVFSAIQKRLYRSLKKEFAKLYRLNGIYLDDIQQYKKILATAIITKEDYSDDNLDIIPVSDPSMSSDAQRLARARAMMEMLPMTPPQGHNEILRNWLEALQTPELQIRKIIDPEADNKAEMMQAEAVKMQQMEAAKAMMEQQMKAEEIQIKADSAKALAELNMALARESAARIENMEVKATLKQQEIFNQNVKDHTDLSIKAVKKMSDLDEMAYQEALKRSGQ